MVVASGGSWCVCGGVEGGEYLLAVLLKKYTTINTFTRRRTANGSGRVAISLGPMIIANANARRELGGAPTPIRMMATGRVGGTNVASFRRTVAVLIPSLSFSAGSVNSCLVVGNLSGGCMLVLVGNQGLAKSVSGGVSLSHVSVDHIGHVRILSNTNSSLCNSSTVTNMVGVVAGRPGRLVRIASAAQCRSRHRLARVMGTSVTARGFNSCASCGRRRDTK